MKTKKVKTKAKAKTACITDWFSQSTIGKTLGNRVTQKAIADTQQVFPPPIINITTSVAKAEPTVEKEPLKKERKSMVSFEDEPKIFKVTPGKKRPPHSQSSQDEVTIVKVTPPKKNDCDHITLLDVKPPPAKKKKKTKVEETEVVVHAVVDLAQRYEGTMMPGTPLAVMKKNKHVIFYL